MMDAKHKKSSFLNTSYARTINKPWGYELHFVPDNLPYMGKMIHIQAGKRLSLQVHDKKQESWMILRGRAKVIWENDKGQLVETELLPNRGYTCAIGQKHRLVGITDCDIIEVSSAEVGTTYRLEDDYSRPDETEEQRKIERSSN
jgi:mannose-6-phosphate isomerase-like protein (cupin superfamily)